MENGTISKGNLIRLLGLMGVAVGTAWAVQILCGGDDTQGVRFLWVMAAATVSGAGVGAIFVSGQLTDREAAVAVG